jgi:hypothetical protein
LALALAGCGSAPRVARYRFTVEVDDNGRIVSGSSVQEEDCIFNDGLFKGMGNAVNCGVRGEAVVVDLGSKGQLFVSLIMDEARPHISVLPLDLLLFAHRDQHNSSISQVANFDRLISSRDAATFSVANMPLMVHFASVDDPTSVERIDPEHLDASFGPGVKLEKATVVMTNDALTMGIEKWIPWLDKLSTRHASLDGDSSSSRLVKAPLANQLFLVISKRGCKL